MYCLHEEGAGKLLSRLCLRNNLDLPSRRKSQRMSPMTLNIRFVLKKTIKKIL